jgi:hypothetical protein
MDVTPNCRFYFCTNNFQGKTSVKVPNYQPKALTSRTQSLPYFLFIIIPPYNEKGKSGLRVALVGFLRTR